MPALLVALDQGPDIRVGRAPVVVGRHSRCDARIGSFRVSRRHCCLAQAAGAIVVRDLGSANGVWINGRRVEESGRLRPGDELAIADVRYRLQVDPPARPGPADRPAGSHREPAAPYAEGGDAR